MRERQEWETCDLIMIVLLLINMLRMYDCEHSGNYCCVASNHGHGRHNIACGNARCNSGEHGQEMR